MQFQRAFSTTALPRIAWQWNYFFSFTALIEARSLNCIWILSKTPMILHYVRKLQRANKNLIAWKWAFKVNWLALKFDLLCRDIWNKFWEREILKARSDQRSIRYCVRIILNESFHFSSFSLVNRFHGKIVFWRRWKRVA